MGRYHSNATDGKSTTGVAPNGSISYSNAYAAAHNIGSKIWMMDFATMFTIWLLYLVEYADWNSQAKIGGGSGISSNIVNSGYTDSMQYHTGTTASTRSVNSGVQYRNIEGLWDNVLDYLGGCYYDTSTNLYIVLNPSDFPYTSNNSILVGTIGSTAANGYYPTGFSKRDVSGAFPMFAPSSGDSTNGTTYSCDQWRYNENASNFGLYLCHGGRHNSSIIVSDGLFYIGNIPDNMTTTNHGYRLMELPSI